MAWFGMASFQDTSRFRKLEAIFSALVVTSCFQVCVHLRLGDENAQL